MRGVATVVWLSLPGRIEGQLLKVGHAGSYLFGWLGRLGWLGAVCHGEQEFGAVQIACHCFSREQGGDFLWFSACRPVFLLFLWRMQGFAGLLFRVLAFPAGFAACSFCLQLLLFCGHLSDLSGQCSACARTRRSESFWQFSLRIGGMKPKEDADSIRLLSASAAKRA